MGVCIPFEEVHTNRYRSANRFIYEPADIVSKGGVLKLNMAPNELGEVPIGGECAAGGRLAEEEWGGYLWSGSKPTSKSGCAYHESARKTFFHIKEQLAPDVEMGIKTKVNRCYLLHMPFQNDLSFEQVADVIRLGFQSSLRKKGVWWCVEYDGVLKIYDETLIPSDEEIIQLPVAKCEYTNLV